jgi:hypothetical protein
MTNKQSDISCEGLIFVSCDELIFDQTMVTIELPCPSNFVYPDQESSDLAKTTVSQGGTMPKIHYPKQKMFPIWIEGYKVTGEYSPARLLGTYPGESFDEAVEAMVAATDEATFGKVSKGRFCESPEAYDIWGCRLFDNEKDARAFVG